MLEQPSVLLLFRPQWSFQYKHIGINALSAMERLEQPKTSKPITAHSFVLFDLLFELVRPIAARSLFPLSGAWVAWRDPVA
jgi:hypothetical protein